MYSKEQIQDRKTVEGMSSSSRGCNSYLVQYKNCRLLRDHQLVRDDLWVRDGIIQDPRKLFWEEKIASDKQVDCGGCIISPGFIDTQINGGFGFDFSSATTDINDSICLVAKKILAHGVTAFCPTIITSSRETYKKVSTQYSRLCDDKHSSGAKVLGLHLEGPFISKEKRGAHPSDLIRSFAEDGFNDVMNMYHVLQNVAIVTLAPEIPLSDHVIRTLTGQGIRVALGHSVANLEESERAVENGANFITHLFNAMLPFHHRDPGLVGLLGSSKIPSNKIVYYGIIADGIHTNPAALRIAYKAHPEGVVLITDANPPWV
ncbi:putative N-acetylglucosamine-6-phosphate deacetylase isoform X1 [Apostichopus japonicus]|uniref:N-acetylglucosamine-6-phosphate deacetylase n=1 Tax=Stichopus japonicus TaxID=307972 RepID=A0A2G8LJU6_STIJA|nr:putative N-acetylglucosamine-6-phosphate deacetylase isoform X1 [Apostichopus japonicus]